MEVIVKVEMVFYVRIVFMKINIFIDDLSLLMNLIEIVFV